LRICFLVDLRIEFDEQDRAQLAGQRPGSELVRIGGKSTSTADQLYLALRVDSVEDYLNRANALPFVADDIFVNFDNARASAGSEILGQLSRKTRYAVGNFWHQLSPWLNLKSKSQVAFCLASRRVTAYCAN